MRSPTSRAGLASCSGDEAEAMDDKKKKERRIEADLRKKKGAQSRVAASLKRQRRRQPPKNPINPAILASRLARTPTPCSCPMCGNPRKFAKGAERMTYAEAKALLAEKDGDD